MKIFPAKAQRRNEAPAFSFPSLRLCGKNLLSAARAREIASRLIAIALALSFFAMLAPISSASSEQSAMACCVGKTAGHCDSGISQKKVPLPKSEPMCGLDTATEDDGITIVAEPAHNNSHHSLSQKAESSSFSAAAESVSVTQPCEMDCGACATASSRQHKREKTLLQTKVRHVPALAIVSRFENLTSFFSSNEDWSRISPRGPPTSLF